MTDHGPRRLVEAVAAAHLEAMYVAAGADSRAALGMGHTRVGQAFVGVMAEDPTEGFWSRAIGLDPANGPALDEAIAFARDAGARSLVVPVAGETSGDLLLGRGLVPGEATTRFLVPGGFTAHAGSGLHLEQIGPDIGKHFAHVMCAAYEMPEDSPLPRWIVESMAAPGVTSYAAFDGWKIVAVAWLFVHDGVARLRGAATLPEERGRGAHAALVARRIHDANALGVRWITTEVGSADNPALRTLLRLGLTTVHETRDWTWRP